MRKVKAVHADVCLERQTHDVPQPFLHFFRTAVVKVYVALPHLNGQNLLKDVNEFFLPVRM